MSELFAKSFQLPSAGGAGLNLEESVETSPFVEPHESLSLEPKPVFTLDQIIFQIRTRWPEAAGNYINWNPVTAGIAYSIPDYWDQGGVEAVNGLH